MSNRSTYIPLHGDVYANKKTIVAARALTKGDVHKMVGHLGRLWTWALDRNDDGDLSHLTDQMIADAAGWTGRASRFVAAITKAGFLDGKQIHSWSEYGGKLAERRENDANRKREKREAERAEQARTLMLSAGQSADSPQNVGRMSVRSPAKPSQAEPREPASSSLREVREEGTALTLKDRFTVALTKVGCNAAEIKQLTLDNFSDLAFEVIVEKAELLARKPTTGDPVSRFTQYLKKCEDTLEEARARVREGQYVCLEHERIFTDHCGPDCDGPARSLLAYQPGGMSHDEEQWARILANSGRPHAVG